MDMDVLDVRLQQLCSEAMSQARKAVDSAPDGAWIADSEWPVREIFQRLARDGYEAILQERVRRHPGAAQPSFSPGGGRGSAEQG